MRLATPGIKIGVFPGAAYEERCAFFSALGDALGLAFEARNPGSYQKLAGVLLFSNSPSDFEACRASGLSVLQFCLSGGRRPVATRNVTFAPTSAVHASFRGLTVREESLTEFCPLTMEQGVLAWIDGLPVWSREEIETRSLHRVGIDLPSPAPNAFFYQFFQHTSWFQVLPLLAFLRECVPASCWLETESRASIIIDDPNLHSSGYGFINYQDMVRHADRHNYHVAIAAIPLDMWYTNRAAAEIFRKNTRRISLVFHGVDHTTNELAEECSDETAFATLAEGLNRVERFERKSGLSVSRVMTAPHGAFVEHFASAMARFPFEGACVSLPSLMYWNRTKQWPVNTGLTFAQPMGKGSFPVFHRFGAEDIPLYAFLGHPIIVFTHHLECAGSYDRFEKWANTINGISQTRWCSIGEIARANYYSQRSGDALSIFLYCRRCQLQLPAETNHLVFRSTPFCTKETHVSMNSLYGKKEPVIVDDLALCWEESANRLSVQVPRQGLLSRADVTAHPIPWWPYLRRFLTEARDRSLPLKSSLGRAKNF